MSNEITKGDATVAFWSAIGTASFTVVFLLSLVVPFSDLVDYATSMGIAVCFLPMTVANEAFAPPDQKIYARLAIAFATIYCILCTTVYYTQLSFVHWGSPGTEALSVVAFQPPRTVYFAHDMLGYFFMSVAVLCVGLSVAGGGPLKWVLIFLGILGGTCVAVPLLPFNYQVGADEEATAFGVLVLIVWAVLYAPIMGLLARHFWQEGKANKQIDKTSKAVVQSKGSETDRLYSPEVRVYQ